MNDAERHFKKCKTVKDETLTDARKSIFEDLERMVKNDAIDWKDPRDRCVAEIAIRTLYVQFKSEDIQDELTGLKV